MAIALNPIARAHQLAVSAARSRAAQLARRGAPIGLAGAAGGTAGFAAGGGFNNGGGMGGGVTNSPLVGGSVVERGGGYIKIQTPDGRILLVKTVKKKRGRRYRARRKSALEKMVEARVQQQMFASASGCGCK